MSWHLQIQMNDKLYLRDPMSSDLGKRILAHGSKMIDQLGLEDFTFKKLATELHTNESSVYRYFENKHRLLIYLTGWYWRWLEYLVLERTDRLKSPVEKIDVVLSVLMLREGENINSGSGLDKTVLHNIVIKEGSKTYLTHHVTDDNQQQFFKPYKDLCGRIAAIFHEINSDYRFARSLASTIIEMSHYQYYFMNNLPSLTDFGQNKDVSELMQFLKSLVLSSLATRVEAASR
jgi:AcrR family transcriptional regulator